MIRILYYATIREYTNLREEQIEADTLGALFDYITRTYGRDACKAMKAGMMTVNGVRLDKLERKMPLPDGSEIGAFAFCCGG